MAFTEDLNEEDSAVPPVRLEVGDTVGASSSKPWFPGGNFHPVTLEDAAKHGPEMIDEIVRDYERRINSAAETYLNMILKAVKMAPDPYDGAYVEQTTADKKPLPSYAVLMQTLAKMNISILLSHEKSGARVYRAKLVHKWSDAQ
jgi:hypothetical protein